MKRPGCCLANPHHHGGKIVASDYYLACMMPTPVADADAVADALGLPPDVRIVEEQRLPCSAAIEFVIEGCSLPAVPVGCWPYYLMQRRPGEFVSFELDPDQHQRW